MGLRTASVRHPHVEVMAPALTEPNQAANFKLPPDTQSASPINGIDDNISYVPHQDDTPRIKANTDQAKLLIPNGKELNDVLDNLNTLVLATEVKKENGSLGKIFEASDNAPLDSINSSFIMSNSSISMDDQDEDKMGLQKSGLDNVLNLLKEKPTSEVDQIFNNLPSFPDSDLTATGDIGQNVDEIMQVITSMEGGNERMNNVNIGGESENIFPLALFNEMDVMSMGMEEPLMEGSISKETQTKDLIADVQKRQVKIERRLEFLLRRLRKIQIRTMGQHFSAEVAGVFEHVHRTLRRLKDGVSIHTEVSETSTSSVAHQLAETIIPSEKMKPISSSSAKNLVRKLETSAILQSNTASRRHSTRYFGSGSIETSAFRSSVSGMINVPVWSPEHKQDFHRVAGLLHTEMGLVQQEVDSEATASSSGGESCDEMQNYNNSQQQYLSIQKRAAWKYAIERAAIAARWTWLQAQISDLEYRIRQHSDLYKQIRSSKGAVALGDDTPPHSLPTSPNILNGYRGQLPGASPASSKIAESTVNGSVGATVSTCTEYQCARTRPLVNFRKRKLLQTTGLHAVSKKAARPSTIRCGCVKPNVPCALCTGRTDPTHPRDPTEYLSKSERIAMLDPCFHPVFSLLEDCSASIHLDAIMKTPEWQQRSSRSTIKSMKYITKSDRLDKMNVPIDHRSKKLDQRRKYPRLLKSTTVNTISAKIKNKIRGRKSNRHAQMARMNKKRHASRMAAQAQAALYAGCEDEELENFGHSGPSGKFDSPSTSPLLATQSISGFQRRNRVDSYDIDNIVIPYSVAASTRVEKLQYKEILTPKWREVEYFDSSKHEVKNNGAVKNTSQDSDIEDITDDAVITRHEKCEHDEKKKFLSYLKLPLGYGRSRSHKRTDSRAESSGANTPDPMSPHTGDQNESMCSPLTSPPATPLSVTTDDNSNLSSNNPQRRRTISQSRHCKDKERELMIKEEPRCNTPEHVDVPPYEQRAFPLCDDIYLKMKKNMPENHLFTANISTQDSFDDILPSNAEEKVEFHDSESTESAYGDEDPNDPEWIEMERIKDRSKR